ncbi:MAG: hypothetical protein VX527_11335, partial [Planctomycetota bacterium]|nr:hypothetical protein [Planctomycetota bacterium]
LPAGTEVKGAWELANTETNPRNPFVPLQRYITARRTGTLATLLHVAAADPDDDAVLLRWHQDMLQSRQGLQP